MHVETIQMDPRIARIHHRDYVKKVRENNKERAKLANARARELQGQARTIRIPKTQQQREDEEFLSSYRVLARGERIINMHRVLWGGGLNALKQPNFAIAGANWEDCFFSFENGPTRAQFSSKEWLPNNTKKDRYSLPLVGAPVEFLTMQERNDLGWSRLKAKVPRIPAHLTPKGDLGEYHILWEAEWQKIAPRDPLLLKRIPDSDKFFIILAQWDLTPLEQQVLEGRFR